MQERGAGRPPGAVIVRARHRGTVIFGCLTVLWLLALAVAANAQPTASGRAGAVIIFGGLAALSVGSWFAVNVSRRRLEVGRDEIAIRPGTKGKPFTLTRVEGDTLRILPRFRMLGAVRPPRLMFLGRGGLTVARPAPSAPSPGTRRRRPRTPHGWPRRPGSTERHRTSPKQTGLAQTRAHSAAIKARDMPIGPSRFNIRPRRRYIESQNTAGGSFEE